MICTVHGASNLSEFVDWEKGNREIYVWYIILYVHVLTTNAVAIAIAIAFYHAFLFSMQFH